VIKFRKGEKIVSIQCLSFGLSLIAPYGVVANSSEYRNIPKDAGKDKKIAFRYVVLIPGISLKGWAR
jgi:hypothetical protein